MAKKKRRWHRPNTIHIAATGGALAGIIKPVMEELPNLMAGNFSGLYLMGAKILRAYTGWDYTTNTFYPPGLMEGLAPALLGSGVSWLANKTGVNRRISDAGVPFLRI